ncbi:MAG: GmrSD restriction endonuclease domain-containing protein [Blastocatellia bacterium]
MKIATILDHIDSGHMALPEFQRGYVWNRDQVRGLFDSLYRRHPVGGLLVWATQSQSAHHRGDGPLASGVVKLLLDGQQRMTSLYGVLRGHPPRFFDGNPATLTGLHFHLEDEIFEFYQPVKMRDDQLWIDLTELMKGGNDGLGAFVTRLSSNPDQALNLGQYVGRLSRLLAIRDIELHIEEVTGADKTLDVVVDIFNRVNSGGTKLSKGDLALAKICSDWEGGRVELKRQLDRWAKSRYEFSLDWLLRSVNTVLTGEAKFLYLHEQTAEDVQAALQRATHHIDTILNLISGRLGLDHDQVFFGRFAVPVMARYLDLRQSRKLGPMNEKERDKLLFWYVQAAMWGRFSGSTESFIDQDLAALEANDGALDKLLETLQLWHGGLRAAPGHFTGWSLGARFYPVLYMLTRMGSARDWGTGLPLTASLLGKMSRLEVHHIFPKARLYKGHFKKSEVNALANFCFLTKETNLDISARLPEDYFPQIEAAHPGALASQWIPEDSQLWRIDRYRDFLEARKELLAAELNRRMEELLHGETQWLDSSAALPREPVVLGGIAHPEEEAELSALNDWVESVGLPRGVIGYDVVDPETGDQRAILDLAWPDGLQEELSQPVAVLLNEDAAVISFASQSGYRCFDEIRSFRQYVDSILS